PGSTLQIPTQRVSASGTTMYSVVVSESAAIAGCTTKSRMTAGKREAWILPGRRSTNPPGARRPGRPPAPAIMLPTPRDPRYPRRPGRRVERDAANASRRRLRARARGLRQPEHLDADGRHLRRSQRVAPQPGRGAVPAARDAVVGRLGEEYGGGRRHRRAAR